MTGWAELDRLLQTDPRDVGCEQARALLHVYLELVLDDAREEAARRYPGVAAHLLACGPCAQDFDGLLMPRDLRTAGHKDHDYPVPKLIALVRFPSPFPRSLPLRRRQRRSAGAKMNKPWAAVDGQ